MKDDFSKLELNDILSQMRGLKQLEFHDRGHETWYEPMTRQQTWTDYEFALRTEYLKKNCSPEGKAVLHLINSIKGNIGAKSKFSSTSISANTKSDFSENDLDAILSMIHGMGFDCFTFFSDWLDHVARRNGYTNFDSITHECLRIGVIDSAVRNTFHVKPEDPEIMAALKREACKILTEKLAPLWGKCGQCQANHEYDLYPML